MADIYLPANGAKLVVVYHDPYGVDEFHVLAFRLRDRSPKTIDVVTLCGLGLEDAGDSEGEEPAYSAAVLFPDGRVEEVSKDGYCVHISRETFIGITKQCIKTAAEKQRETLA